MLCITWLNSFSKRLRDFFAVDILNEKKTMVQGYCKKLNQEKVVIHYSYALCSIDLNQVQCSQRKITYFKSLRTCKLYKNIIEVLEVEGSLEMGKQN